MRHPARRPPDRGRTPNGTTLRPWPASSRCSSPRPAGAHHPVPAPDSIAMGGSVHAASPPSGLDPRADAVGRQLPRPQAPAPRPPAQHGLRGGPLPEHRGVLGPAHRHDHDPRRHLHPGLRVLRRQDRPPDLVRRRRAAPRRRGGGRHASRARRRDQRRPRRPARRRVADLRRDHQLHARASPGHGHRGPHPGLRRLRRSAADGHGRPAGHPQPQPRDRAAAPEAGPQAGPLGPLAVRPSPGQGDGARDRLPGPHQVEPDGRPRRDARRAPGGVRGAARERRRHPDRSASTCDRRCSTCRSSATTTPTSSPR